jgi:hypothetical protein
MGRSPGDSSDINPPEDKGRFQVRPGEGTADARAGEGANARLDALRTVGIAQKQLLENVRRALGKLVTFTKVQEISIAETGQMPAVSTNDLLDVVVPSEMEPMDYLSIPVSDRPAGIPSAEPGGGGVDLASVVTVVSPDSAVNAAVTESYVIDVAYAETHSYEIPHSQLFVPTPEPTKADLNLLGGEVRNFSLDRVGAVATGSLPVDRIQVSVPTRRSVTEAMQPMRLGVRTSLAHAYQIPMVRRSSIERRGQALNLKERERLAQVSNSSLENVALIGLFRNVPVTAVSRLSVEEEAAELLIWLKPEAVKSAGPLKMVNLLIGRDTVSGKMIQTVA